MESKQAFSSDEILAIDESHLQPVIHNQCIVYKLY